MGGTGWAFLGSLVLTTSNWGVFNAGICTMVTCTLLLSWNSSARRESQNPWMACFDPQYADCSGIPR